MAGVRMTEKYIIFITCCLLLIQISIQAAIWAAQTRI